MSRAPGQAPTPTALDRATKRADRTARLARIQQRIDLPGRWALLALGVWVAWRTREAGWLGMWPWILGAYALIALLTSGFWANRAEGRQWERMAPWLTYAAFACDAIFACALIWRDGGLGGPLYILLLLLASKAVALAQALPGMLWAPFAFGPLYVLALRLTAGNLAFLADPNFQARYLLMWAWLVGNVLIAWELARRTAQAEAAQAEATRLDATLLQQQVALAQKTEVLQRTATDLGDRVLELRSLQEVARALASTLGLEETLQLIVEHLRGVTGSSHCAVALVDADSAAAPWEGSHLAGTLATDQARAAQAFRLSLAAEPATLEALRDNHMVRVRGDGPRVRGDTPLRQLLGAGGYLITPLVSRGRPIGALYLAENTLGDAESPSAPAAAGRNKTEQLVSSFAYFAATAIENARLYQDAWEKRRELEAVLAGIGDGVVVVDPDLNVILINPVARDILGLEGEPPAGVPLSPYLPAPAFADLLAETLRDQHELIRELDLEPARDGGAHTYGVLAAPVLDADGEVSGVVAVLRDITAQKELERMKSNFLSVVSHELRTPLHSIKGFVEIILMGKTGSVTELQKDFLQTVKAQTGVLQRMIDDLLEFSRMEAGRVKLHLAEVYLPGVAHAVATKLAPLAEEGGLTLILEMPDDLPEIDGDWVRLEQVFTNLMENAIKFTAPGGQIRVTGGRLGERVRLTVADTGIGIPPDEQERVFDRFYQVDGSERRAYRGTGLGLSICKHIVERHNGRIWVESDG
ncbi:MAG: hypothetical protein CVU38_04075, partial [Chloroflexi bacterium HGW-Chloroflexi-1]